ncbi:hypothetical protein [Methylotenera oryzisoli]|nr:hypothetical protein [Methylotenera oryzisoli]
MENETDRCGDAIILLPDEVMSLLGLMEGDVMDVESSNDYIF